MCGANAEPVIARFKGRLKLTGIVYRLLIVIQYIIIRIDFVSFFDDFELNLFFQT